jgi:hypothetical protein
MDCQIKLERKRPQDPSSDHRATCTTHNWTGKWTPGHTSATRSAAGHKRAQLRSTR